MKLKLMTVAGRQTAKDHLFVFQKFEVQVTLHNTQLFCTRYAAVSQLKREPVTNENENNKLTFNQKETWATIYFLT